MTTPRARLAYLGRAYFHQDYELDFPGPAELITGFRQNESPHVVGELVADIDSLLSSEMSDADIGELWVDELHASYDPAADQIGYRQWFTTVRRLLTEDQ